jgi:hypothetical protein
VPVTGIRARRREKVIPGTGREAGLGHPGSRAAQEQLPRMRG